MSDYYCPVCNVRKVSHEGEICTSCQDPYQDAPIGYAANTQNAQTTVTNTSYSERRYDAAATLHDETPMISHSSGRRIIGANPAPQPASNAPNRAIISSQPQSVTVKQQPTIAPLVNNTILPGNNSSANTQQNVSVKGTKTPMTEGIIRNITNSKDQNGVIGRWFKSLFIGIPFTSSDEIIEFQVFTNWSGNNLSGGYSADKVIVYGNIETGKPLQDNSVRVYGKRDKNRSIIAEEIENTTDGTISVFNPRPISAKTVRIITIGILMVIFAIFNALASGLGNGVTDGIGAFLRNGLTGIIWGVVAVISGKRMVSNFGNNWKNTAICAFVAIIAAMLAIRTIF